MNQHDAIDQRVLLARMDERVATQTETLHELRGEVRQNREETARLANQVNSVQRQMADLNERERERNGKLGRLRTDVDALKRIDNDRQVAAGVIKRQVTSLGKAFDVATSGGVVLVIGYVAKLLGVL